MNYRWDETYHRLLEWTSGQGPSERLAAQVLFSEGYASLDPSHPLGGPDGGKDALGKKDGRTALMAVYFPRGQQAFAAIKTKLLADLAAAATHGASEFVFVTNQAITVGERDALKNAAGTVLVELYHLERIIAILDKPAMSGVRKQFLGIEFVSTWPDAVLGEQTPAQLATQVESVVAATVEILLRVDERLIVWLKPPAEPTRADLPEVKVMFLRVACVLSGVADIRSIEIGFSNTSELRHSLGGDGIGNWRASFRRDAVMRVATSKVIDPNFWKGVTVLLTTGDNLRVGQIEEPFPDFEAKA